MYGRYSGNRSLMEALHSTRQIIPRSTLPRPYLEANLVLFFVCTFMENDMPCCALGAECQRGKSIVRHGRKKVSFGGFHCQDEIVEFTSGQILSLNHTQLTNYNCPSAKRMVAIWGVVTHDVRPKCSARFSSTIMWWNLLTFVQLGA